MNKQLIQKVLLVLLLVTPIFSGLAYAQDANSRGGAS